MIFTKTKISTYCPLQIPPTHKQNLHYTLVYSIPWSHGLRLTKKINAGMLYFKLMWKVTFNIVSTTRQPIQIGVLLPFSVRFLCNSDLGCFRHFSSIWRNRKVPVASALHFLCLTVRCASLFWICVSRNCNINYPNFLQF